MRKPFLEHVSGAAGLDEAGRGPLAGPVTAAAVILPDGFDLKGIDDSKKLTAAQREALVGRIKAECTWAVVSVSETVIDQVNILWASMQAMEEALALLSIPPAAVLVDGNQVPRKLVGRAEAVIGGDAKYACIAAASILAKTERDELMRSYALTYPAYGFERHFGYPTPDHLAALREHGPCPIHRRSFGPVAAEQLSLFEVGA